MHLTLRLLKSAGGQKKRAQGLMWTGKHRITHGIYPDNIAVTVKQLKIEENNLLLLRHPYLTFEQEQGHGMALGKPEKWRQQDRLFCWARKMQISVRMEDVLAHLQHENKWEL